MNVNSIYLFIKDSKDKRFVSIGTTGHNFNTKVKKHLRSLKLW